MDTEAQFVSGGLWRWLQGTGLERFEFLRVGDESMFRGTILAFAGNAAAEARYEIVCDAAFQTRHAQISVRVEGTERVLQLEAGGGQWFENSRENPLVRGAVDIDLGWSPCTNTLPIRRLGLAIGQSSGEFIAAWVRFPELVLEPLPQQYIRLSDRVYRYSSRGEAFTAELLVDENGIVTQYEGFWQRTANK